MTEPAPTYHAPPAPDHTAAADAPGPVVVVVAPAGLTDELRRYLELKRDTLIAELRAIDRMLGRPQTVPVRER